MPHQERVILESGPCHEHNRFSWGEEICHPASCVTSGFSAIDLSPSQRKYSIDLARYRRLPDQTVMLTVRLWSKNDGCPSLVLRKYLSSFSNPSDAVCGQRLTVWPVRLLGILT